MRKLIILTIFAFFLLLSMNFVNAEVYLWNSVIVDSNASLVKYHAFYWLDDTSEKGINTVKDIPITLWYVVEPLPLNLTYGQVDWCNLSISHSKHIYDTEFIAFEGFFGGKLLNTTEEKTSYYFTTGALNSSQLAFNLRARDTLVATMTCHYTDINSLYQENILAGRFTTFMSSYECFECKDTSIQEQYNQIDNMENITANELTIYRNIQTAISWDYQLWVIASWILKIFFVFIGIGLIFATGYFFYKVITDIAKEIK